MLSEYVLMLPAFDNRPTQCFLRLHGLNDMYKGTRSQETRTEIKYVQVSAITLVESRCAVKKFEQFELLPYRPKLGHEQQQQHDSDIVTR